MCNVATKNAAIEKPDNHLIWSAESSPLVVRNSSTLRNRLIHIGLWHTPILIPSVDGR